MDIGIVESGFSSPGAIASAVRSAEAIPIAGSAQDIVSASPDLVLVKGWESLRACVTADPAIPILCVDRPSALAPVERQTITSAIQSIREGAGTECSHVSLSVNDDHVALSEVMLMTEEPATISEYAVRCDGADVCQYRADGMVIASPVGSGAYARAAGGPILDPSISSVAVVPIAPYHTDPNQWILSGRVTVDIVRDTDGVGLFLDGDEVTTLSTEQSLSIQCEDTYRSIRTPESQSPFAPDDY